MNNNEQAVDFNIDDFNSEKIILKNDVINNPKKLLELITKIPNINRRSYKKSFLFSDKIDIFSQALNLDLSIEKLESDHKVFLYKSAKVVQNSPFSEYQSIRVEDAELPVLVLSALKASCRLGMNKEEASVLSEYFTVNQDNTENFKSRLTARQLKNNSDSESSKINSFDMDDFNSGKITLKESVINSPNSLINFLTRIPNLIYRDARTGHDSMNFDARLFNPMLNTDICFNNSKPLPQVFVIFEGREEGIQAEELDMRSTKELKNLVIATLRASNSLGMTKAEKESLYEFFEPAPAHKIDNNKLKF